ncbi:PilN domain-containing protein [uncultured Tenacibaculum sp.]|uniref:PilN domain-containing protein n=1 Tax=uncultured Tenacibaculum sp. TaxID=174713 RepID=UPI0026107893|nr:PilN domain-containing protein [uncultured Tenacibaculum sp.]
MNKIQQRLFYENSYSAIEHSFVENSEEINVLHVSKKKNELVITDRSQCKTPNEVLTSFKGQKHSYLIINNQQVLSKKVDNIEEDEKLILRNTFPNIVVTDFYYEMYTSNESTFIAICRRSYVDELIEKYKELKISIIGFSLGNLSIKELAPFLKENVHTSNALISVGVNQINAIEKTNVISEIYVINDLNIANNEVLTLAGILSIFFSKSVYQKGLEEKNSSLLKDFKSKQLFGISLKAGLGLLFVVLLINFVLFSTYSSKTNALKEHVALNKTQKEFLLSLKKEIVQKEKIVSSLETASLSNVSRYIDIIAETIPNTILLKEIKYQPLKSQIKKDKPIFVNEKNILVKGIAKSNEDFLKLVANLKKNDWVNNITIVKYGKEKTTNSSFELLIHISNE